VFSDGHRRRSARKATGFRPCPAKGGSRCFASTVRLSRGSTKRGGRGRSNSSSERPARPHCQRASLRTVRRRPAVGRCADVWPRRRNDSDGVASSVARRPKHSRRSAPNGRSAWSGGTTMFSEAPYTVLDFPRRSRAHYVLRRTKSAAMEPNSAITIAKRRNIRSVWPDSSASTWCLFIGCTP